VAEDGVEIRCPGQCQRQPQAPPQHPPPEDTEPDGEDEDAPEDLAPFAGAAKTENCIVCFVLAHVGHSIAVFRLSTMRS